MNNRLKILLTGASGTLGAKVLEELLKQNESYQVTVFDLKTKASEKLLSKYNEAIEVIYGDITNSEDVEKACASKDFVIHLAAVIPPLADEKPDLAHRVNILGTKHLVNGLEKFSPGAFLLYGSSISVYGDRLKNPWIKVDDSLLPSVGDHYAETKIEAENIIQNSHLSWSIFRLTAIMGTNNHKISKLLFHMPLDTALEIVTPRDAARAFVNALGKKSRITNQIFNLGGGTQCRISFKDFLSRSFDHFGLGQLNFPESAFAQKNFHCGYYADGDDLEEILHFRNDTIESYFQSVRQSISPFQKAITSAFRLQVKRYLLKQSEPYIAQRDKQELMISRFFYEKENKK